MQDTNSGEHITVDGLDYLVSELSETAKAQLMNINFVEKQLQQLNNEWAIADTARLAYTKALKADLANSKQTAEKD